MPTFNIELEIDAEPSVGQELLRHVTRDDSSETVIVISGITVLYQKVSKLLTIRLPLTAVDPLFYYSDSNRIIITSDLRRLVVKGHEIDARAFYSLLQFGMMVPPLSPWKNIKQFYPGKKYVIAATDLSIEEYSSSPQWPVPDEADSHVRSDRQVETVTQLIDKVLIESCPFKDPIILFSGGVDSGVLAARAAAMGWKDSTLVNYCFGSNDKEAVLAERMAKHFNLDFLQINEAKSDALAILGVAAKTFTHPFGDPSTLPTSALAHAVIKQFDEERVVFDGTGADGAFGLFPKAHYYQNIYRVPKILRSLIGSLYKPTGYWRAVSSIERYVRVLRRTAMMPEMLASIARNPLLHITYNFPHQIHSEVLDLISQWITSSVPSHDIDVRLPAADLMILCSKVLAQKDKSIFDAHTRKIVYPFLDERMVGLAMQRARFWPGSKEPKWVLKALLAGHVPSDMVYRKKSGFVPPFSKHFSQPEFLSVFDQIISGQSILSQFLHLPRMKKLRNMLQSRRLLPDQTYWFIWTVVFTHCWFNQLDCYNVGVSDD